MIKTLVTVFFVFLYLVPQQIFSQPEQEALPLMLILDQLQENFDCDFTFIDDDINDIKVKKPPSNLTLKEVISYLQDNTPIDYTFVSPKNIALSAKNSILEICGVLQSIINGEPLADAIIQTKNRTTSSNEKGKFSLQLENKKQWITINFTGYKSVKILAEDFIENPCKIIILIPEVQILSEVILNDYLVKGINKKSDGSIIIDYKDFGIIPGLIEPDLLQTIQALPGVLSVEETVSDINVRGGTNDQNLILWDGIKMYQSSHFFGLISAFNPYLTKNVQLSKNGSSASYGDGVSSVIAMNTSNELTKELEASTGINMISVDGYLDTPLGKKSSIQISARKSISEVLETPTYNQFFDKAFQDSEVTKTSSELSATDQEFSFYDTSIRWLYQLSNKDLIKVNGIFMNNDLVFQENALFNQTNISRESSAKQSNIAGSILYRRNWNQKSSSELLFYGTNHNLETINSDIANDQRLLQENEVTENGIKTTTLFKLSSNFNLKSGFQFNETGISNLTDVNNPTFRDFKKEVIRTNSIFSETEYVSKSKNTYFNFGFRINHFDKFNKVLLEPRMSFNHRFDNHFTIEFLGELKSQVTLQIIESQNDFLGVENRKWILSNNETVPIIQSQQGSIGLSYNHNNWLISADIFHKNVDGIISQSQGFQNQFEFKPDNGSYTVRGIDFLINKRFKKFGTWLSYSYASNEYTFKSLSDINFPNNIDIRHNINIAITHTTENFKFSTGVNWHSGKPTTRPRFEEEIADDGTINYLGPNSDQLEDYFRWDASATYRFNISKKISGNAGVSAWNILSQENIVNNYYRITPNNGVEEVKQLGLGFTPNIVFRINF